MNKALAKNVGVVVVGIMIAGYIFEKFPALPIVADARNGYGQ